MIGTMAAAALAAGVADAAHGATTSVPKVSIGQVALASPAAGKPGILVAVTYPRHMKGRPGSVRVRLLDGGRVVVDRRSAPLLSAGLHVEEADLRRSFGFVHRVPLPARQLERLLHGSGRLVADVRAEAVLDIERDGRAEVRSSDRVRRTVQPAGAGAPLLCETPPLQQVERGRSHAIATPVCTAPLRWSLARRAAHAAVRRAGGRFVYRSAGPHQGPDGLVLRGQPLRASTPRAAAVSAADSVLVPVPLQVSISGLAPTTSVRAIGDSVTAGFGYFYDRSEMGITQLPGCRPTNQLYDACSSNSLTTSNAGPLVYAPDYGLSNLIAWPARWAGWNGITNFANYAVTGSAPGDWAPGGQFHRYTAAAMAAAPDYLVFTLGANPLLSDVLFGIDNMKCALWSDLFGGFTRCVQNAFAAARLTDNLSALYRDLAANSPARTRILVMQYHLAIPSSALAYSSLQLERMSELLNQTLATTAAATSPRLRIVSPPRFFVGSDMSQLYPSNYDCGDGGKVDGASVQSTATQDELEYDPLGGPFCPGPATIATSNPLPWIISGDTGIHPSVTGHRMLANALPTP
ncbi:SGNH/GDSL hydrolase family protein [Conexibacter stalactiti]|uniref:SGNH hydrolase-type esterase domain-containing protein n=1 Tax=Conexibacter stalactiti TaxID=1940611 RepID=A0ABU4HQM4_9ACTN|nr:SGNH/GDSL hydrolase family protein [Conexibacter stalactiti]MDW5595603.1 hypothetical protein [Conexibacter stalactiti]MEC5036245.1 SGNH/GDSL hydrolase family protein [Conexibacter stalactiti]